MQKTQVTREAIRNWIGTEDFTPLDKLERREHDKAHFRQILEYINALYLIEILRYCEVTHLDEHIAWQMGAYENAPWINSCQLVTSVYETQRKRLYHFLNYKFMRAVGKLLQGVENHKDEHYLQTPLNQALIGSIMSAFDQMTTEFKHMSHNWGNLDNWLAYDFTASLDLNRVVPVRHDYSEYTELQVIERLLIGWFDTYAEAYPNLNFNRAKEKYGVHRKEILDDRVYLCYKCLLDKYKDIKELVQGTKHATATHSTFYVKCSAWACLLSILYRLVIPCRLHPNRLECMYEQYILSDHHVAKAIQYARKFSACTAEQVIDDHLPPLSCEYLPENLEYKKYSLSGTYPNSVIERYLVTQYLLEHMCKHAKSDVFL